jgi:hypothetical protein
MSLPWSKRRARVDLGHFGQARAAELPEPDAAPHFLRAIG